MSDIQAKCTWGDGPSIVIEKNNHILCDLNLKNAKDLAGGLLMAIQQVEELEKQCEDHDKELEEKG